MLKRNEEGRPLCSKCGQPETQRPDKSKPKGWEWRCRPCSLMILRERQARAAAELEAKDSDAMDRLAEEIWRDHEDPEYYVGWRYRQNVSALKDVT